MKLTWKQDSTGKKKVKNLQQQGRKVELTRLSGRMCASASLCKKKGLSKCQHSLGCALNKICSQEIWDRLTDWGRAAGSFTSSMCICRKIFTHMRSNQFKQRYNWQVMRSSCQYKDEGNEAWKSCLSVFLKIQINTIFPKLMTNNSNFCYATVDLMITGVRSGETELSAFQ